MDECSFIYFQIEVSRRRLMHVRGHCMDGDAGMSNPDLLVMSAQTDYVNSTSIACLNHSSVNE